MRIILTNNLGVDVLSFITRKVQKDKPLLIYEEYTLAMSLSVLCSHLSSILDFFPLVERHARDKIWIRTFWREPSSKEPYRDMSKSGFPFEN